MNDFEHLAFKIGIGFEVMFPREALLLLTHRKVHRTLETTRFETETTVIHNDFWFRKLPCNINMLTQSFQMYQDMYWFSTRLA